MHFPISAQPQINAPHEQPGAPNIATGAPYQSMQSIAAQKFGMGCAGCSPAVNAQFGADASLTATTWPLWVKIGIVLGVITLGFVAYRVVTR
jgi:hypothetical protein